MVTKDANGRVLISYDYSYDGNGNRIRKNDAQGRVTTSCYDSLQRLGTVSYPDTGIEKYVYDQAGNRVSRQTSSYTESYCYDERNRMISSVRHIEEGGTEDENKQFLYDECGSLLSEEGVSVIRNYAYDDFHHCMEVKTVEKYKEAPASIVKNEYDGEGLRFAQIENDRRIEFVTNGWENYDEFDAGGNVSKRIIRSIGIAASEEDGSYHYYHSNERGDIELITDESGNIVNRYSYDAFGNIDESEEMIGNRYTFNGQVYDRATEQYYLRKRFYNPTVCRFTQEDEYRGDGLNLYVYCSNNPIMYDDPSGYGSNRQDRLGGTPGKDSPTGRRVIITEYQNNPSAFSFNENLSSTEVQVYKDYLDAGNYGQTLPEGFLENVNYRYVSCYETGPDGMPLEYNLPLTDYDMGHHPKDAVTEYNELFSKLGPEGRDLAKEWMYTSSNYQLEPSSENQRRGRELGQTPEGRYVDPETDPQAIEAAKKEFAEEIQRIHREYDQEQKDLKEKKKSCRG